jgi:hypothetical protein
MAGNTLDELTPSIPSTTQFKSAVSQTEQYICLTPKQSAIPLLYKLLVSIQT